MITSKKFKGISEFGRKGVATKVVVEPEQMKKDLVDIVKDKKNMAIKVVAGKDCWLFTDKFGFADKAVINLLFCNDCMLINVVNGVIYMQEEDVIYSVDQWGTIAYPSLGKKTLSWMSMKDVWSHAMTMTQNFYKTPSDSVTESYVNNLTYTIVVNTIPSSKAGGSPCLCTQFTDFYSDFGLDVFEFKKYEAEAPVVGLVPERATSKRLRDDDDIEDSKGYEDEEDNYNSSDDFEDTISLEDLEDMEDDDDDDEGMNLSKYEGFGIEPELDYDEEDEDDDEYLDYEESDDDDDDDF